MSDAEYLWLAFDGSSCELTVSVSGELDYASGGELIARVCPYLASGLERLWLDLSGVAVCDSSGLHALGALQRKAGRAGVDTVLCAPPLALQRLLTMTGLIASFTVVGSPAESLGLASDGLRSRAGHPIGRTE